MTAATLGTRFPISRDLRVIPFRAADLDRPIRCHTRVQEMEVGGQVSNVVQLNLKSGKITPLLDGFSEHLGSSAGSNPVGQRQV